MTPGLTHLASRIARNREIAGLHYPTDSVGGRMLASQIFSTILSNETTPIKSYLDVLKSARLEWP
jgi:hypothetical protein